jgi:Myb/SANT-like DNA-binding domain
LDSSRERMRTTEQRWKEIEDLCKSQNVQRGWKQCKKRWEKLLTDFKKIFDFQAHTPSGGDGYFELERAARKE